MAQDIKNEEVEEVQFRLLMSCFFYRFHNFLFLDFFYFFIFYILGPFSPPLMISILMYFVMITAEVAVKICQLHGQNTVDHIDLVD